MARVSYITEGDHPELADLIGRFKVGRRGNLINIYRLLLNSPALAETWFVHANTVRWKTELPGRLRELMVIRVGYLNRCAYVLRQHIPKLALADGVSEAECAALADWQASDFFAPLERAALAYADAMTRDIDVSDTVFDALLPHYSERQLVELTVLIATYNMLTRILQALQVDLEPAP
jgi:AhpD family alkylhydroperoxidase